MATVEGKATDRALTISWPASDNGADVQVYPAGAMAERAGGQTPGTALAFVPNLYRQFELMGADPIEILKGTDEKSAALVEEAEALSLRSVRGALDNGAVGVFYELHGANAGQCTPMEYGGLFLERDRAFLEAVADAPCNFLYVNGKEPYLDFVSDLPARVFAWDAAASGISVQEVKTMRSGCLMADADAADIRLNAGSTTDLLEGLLAHV